MVTRRFFAPLRMTANELVILSGAKNLDTALAQQIATDSALNRRSSKLGLRAYGEYIRGVIIVRIVGFVLSVEEFYVQGEIRERAQRQ